MFSLSTRLAYLILALAVVALVVTGAPRVSPLVIVDASGQAVAPSLDYLVGVPITSWPEAALDNEKLMARWLEAQARGAEAIYDMPLESWPEAALDDKRLVGQWLEYHTLAGGCIAGGQGSRLCIEEAMEYLAAQGDSR